MRTFIRNRGFLITLTTIILRISHAFQNPIIPGFNPDPTIQRVGKDYFLATSTFEFFPGVPIYHSIDLINWEIIGHALNRPSQLNLRGTAPSGGIFAPTLRYHEQTRTYYMITTLFDIISPPDNVTHTPRSFYVTTKNIWDEKSWSDPTYVDQWGFDPDLFFDTDGRTYLTTTLGSQFVDPDSGYFAIWISEIDIKTGNALSEARLFHVSDLPLNTPRLAEGSHLFKKEGWYYLLTAEAGTEAGHRAMISRARSLNGPWEANPQNPILYNGHKMSNPILATGHADFVSTPTGDWYAVFLGTRPQNPANSTGKNQLGRETFMASMKWVDGWPVINNGEDITFEMPGLYDLERPKKWRDDFSGKLGDKGYYTPRTPYKKFYSLDERPGWLRIKGNPYTLSDRETPATLMRKQVDLGTVWSSELDFKPTNPRHEAGVTIFLSIHYHNEIAITLHPETKKRVIAAKTRMGVNASLNTTYAEIPETGTVKLYIKAEPSKYSLGYATGNGKPIYIAEVENRWLQAYLPGWQVFTGSFFGVYSTAGLGLPMLVPADFNYVETELL
ncbi:uncharacterized protein LAJ45_05982 [Morchella importuna]|uniref:Beta-xylosidase C-terminal Concanavalin A-like domain-containing protein n=1 Tax=Morchella conica CCBAS932 TaxID=1392247 RepID=A0A3N4L3S4_9PEZI|nr:uncharacterized protein LAJ45_05982 [Morchella importuna]KAH8149830.1 hypothetical protein LAJ45_05982 [Morchella importuna]RPB16172.1 hypothetical protein P167DRAFT_532650 [Morchella conica CCBAS932]